MSFYLRSVLVMAIVFGATAMMPLDAAASTGGFRFSLDRTLMPRIAVDARIGLRAHVHFDVIARNSSAAYEVTGVAVRAVLQYCFNDRSELRIDVGPHPSLIANERLAVQYIVRT